jgi:hypothetical protein
MNEWKCTEITRIPSIMSSGLVEPERKVWIIYFSDYDCCQHIKVVDSEEMAKAEVKRLDATITHGSSGGYDYDEYDVE